MVITFQVQIDPLTFYGNTWEPNLDKQFTPLELATMKGDLDIFKKTLDDFGEYIRAEMYVDGKVYRG
ncbi:MAG: hypothetical protein KGI27_09985 [Thaumarchaeota archaeon]|nr:hypothetical protein [Nitrososphaerota archaeon]